MKQFITLFLLIALSACGTAEKIQYSALEKVGIHKRDILVDRIEATTETQEQTKKEFQTAYEQLSSLINIEDSGLEQNYKRMAKAVERSEDKSNELQSRIRAVDNVAKALFEEWEGEIAEYQSENLRQASQNNLATTRERYAQIYDKMQDSYQRVQPVLQVLQDNTLFLKHNLNAQAVNSLSGEAVLIEGKVEDLIKQMEESIEQSRAFISAMRNR